MARAARCSNVYIWTWLSDVRWIPACQSRALLSLHPDVERVRGPKSGQRRLPSNNWKFGSNEFGVYAEEVQGEVPAERRERA